MGTPTLSLHDKVAVVSGGSRGIGAATVKMMAAAGARVVFNYRKAKTEADAVVHACGPERCAAMQLDLEGTENARALVDFAVERFGRVDILVGNHGIWPPEDIPIDQMSDQHWRRTIAINLDSIFALTRHTVAQMKKQGGGGSIVLVSSTAGQRGEDFHVDYAATKGAIISMVKGLATELARDGIRVNCVAPGWTETDMAAPHLNDPVLRQRSLAKIPLGRAARPEEVAAPIVFLCTEHAGFITGEIFNVNGGAVLVG